MRLIVSACTVALPLLSLLMPPAEAASVNITPYRQAFQKTCAVNHSRAFCQCMTQAIVHLAGVANKTPEVRERIGVFPGLGAFALDYAREIGSATDNGISASRLGDAAAYLGKKHGYQGNQEKLNFLTALLWEQAFKFCNRN